MTSDPNHWSLFVCNTYLIPPAQSIKETRTCVHQKDRATALGRMIHKHKPDVVLLQEMWGAGYSQLQKALAKGEPEAYDVPQDDWRGDEQRKAVDAEYKELTSRSCTQPLPSGAAQVTRSANDSTHPSNDKLGDKADKHPPKYAIPLMMRSWWGVEFLDMATQFLGSRGGLWHAHNSATVTVVGSGYPKRHTFAATYFPIHRKSVMVAKVQKAADSTPLLHFNIHLDPGNGPKRMMEKQLIELRDFIAKVVNEEVNNKASNKAGAEGVKPSEGNSESIISAPFAAIIAGDFNITPTSNLYQRFFEIMGDADLFEIILDGDVKNSTSSSCSNQKKRQRVRVVIESLLSADSLATHTYCTNNPTALFALDGRLDHLFVIKAVEIGYIASTSFTTINLQPVSLTYERVLNDHKGGDALVSDHYPFVAEIQVGK